MSAAANDESLPARYKNSNSDPYLLKSQQNRANSNQPSNTDASGLIEKKKFNDPVSPIQLAPVNDQKASRNGSATEQIVTGTLPTPESEEDLSAIVLNRVILEGVTALDTETLRGAFGGYIGQEVAEDDLIAITDAITEIYREEGYFLTRAILPPQEVDEGIVRVKVIEGSITNIIYDTNAGKPYGADKFANPILKQTPLTLKTLERQLLLIGDLPGLSLVETQIDEIGELSGNFSLTIVLNTWKFWGETGVDNRGTEDIGPTQGYTTLSTNSFITGGDALGLDYATIPGAYIENQYGRISYEVPISENGAKLGLRASITKSQPDGDRRLLENKLTTKQLNLFGSIMPIREKEKTLRLTGYFGFKEATSEIFGGIPLYEDRIATIGAVGNLRFKDKRKGTNYLTINLRQGLDAFDASREGDEALSNADGSGKFTKLYAAYSRYQEIDDNLSLRIAMSGQLASRALLSSEEYSIGGIPFGRAFEGGVLSADRGFGAVAELRYDIAVKHRLLNHMQLFTYFDGGKIWQKGEKDGDALTSIGGGVRLNLPHGFYAELEVAKPLRTNDLTDVDDDPKLFFFISRSYKACEENLAAGC